MPTSLVRLSNPTSTDPVSLHDLHLAVVQGLSADRFDRLLQRYVAAGAPEGLNTPTTVQGSDIAQPLLHRAVEQNHEDLVAILLKAPGLDLETRDGEDGDGDTVLFATLCMPPPGGPNPTVLTWLLDAGARIDGTTSLGVGPSRVDATLAQVVRWLPYATTVPVLDVLHARGLLPVIDLDTAGDGLLHDVLDHLNLVRLTREPLAPTVAWLLAHGADAHRRTRAGDTVVDRLHSTMVIQTLGEEPAHATLQAVERWTLNETLRLENGPSASPGPGRARL